MHSQQIYYHQLLVLIHF